MQQEKVPPRSYLKADDLLDHHADLGFTRQAAEFERVPRPVLK